MEVSQLNFSEDPAEILNILFDSEKYKNAIGVKSAVLGDAVFITAVQSITLEEGQTLIEFMHYDSSGYILPVRKVDIKEIQAVCGFTSPFKNPFLDSLQKDRSWFF